MVVTDPVADMLTRIRNANITNIESVDIPLSKLKSEIARILYKEGYIRNYEIRKENVRDIIRIYLKVDRGKKTITAIKRVSKPSRRIYVEKDNIPRILGGLGTVILSTSKGVLTGREAKKSGVGGEVVCYIW